MGELVSCLPEHVEVGARPLVVPSLDRDRDHDGKQRDPNQPERPPSPEARDRHADKTRPPRCRSE